MVEPAVLIAALALGVSAIGFFYKLGRDTRGEKSAGADNEMLSQIYRSTETINKKLDDISDWQREATKVHTSHEERIKTLFNIVSNLGNRMDNLEVINKAIQKILERLG